MATQNSFFFGNASVVSEATAVSVLSLIQGEGFNPTGTCVSLNITFDTDVYYGNASTVTDSDGALVTAGTPVADSASGVGGNTIPLASIFVFKNGVGDADCVIFARFVA